MRARYYNPTIKRFINQNMLFGKLNPGISLNRFAYANGDPIDPLGQHVVYLNDSKTPTIVGQQQYLLGATSTDGHTSPS